MPTVDYVATIYVNIEQSNTSIIDIPKPGERKTCVCTKQTLHKYDYRYFQLMEIVGRGVCKLTPYCLHSFGEKQIGILHVCRNKLHGTKQLPTSHHTIWRLVANIQIIAQYIISQTNFLFQFLYWMSTWYLTYLLNLINIIVIHSDMVWNPSIDLLLYYCPFCDDNMKKVREYAILYPHWNYRDTKEDKEKHQLYNGPYKSKLYFLIKYNALVSIAMGRLNVDIILG